MSISLDQESLQQSISADFNYLCDFRHDLHENPELMYEEFRTSEQVVQELKTVGIEFVDGLAGGTGVVGWLPGQRGSKTVAIRADMDALPIQEETGLPYSSKTPGKMHACGHDGHTAILVGVARALQKLESRQNNILLVFQPAEEGGAGAEKLVKEGILSGKVIGEQVDVIYGLHGNPWIPVGQYSVRDGAMMAATDDFRVTITGLGGHAAMPNKSVDPVIAIAHIITALQTVASRNVSPLESIVFSVTTLEAGHAHNVIPDCTKFSGTMRTLSADVRILGKKRFYEIVEGVASSLGCKVEIDWHEGYPVTVNDVWATNRLRHVARKFIGERMRHEELPTMGGEDFSYYGYEVPASFYYAGLCRESDRQPAGLHTSRFDFNDAVIPECVELMCRLALEPVE